MDWNLKKLVFFLSKKHRHGHGHGDMVGHGDTKNLEKLGHGHGEYTT